jgi:CMP/dCMP kinase
MVWMVPHFEPLTFHERITQGIIMADTHFCITISHQLGSGGLFLGQKLSERLNIPFVDREILKKVAEQLSLAEAVLEHREERISSFWQSLARLAVLTDPSECLSIDNYEPSDKELFDLESRYIGQIAAKSSAVFLGRCGRHILHHHPCHVDILVYANMPERTRRVQEIYCLEENQARKLIETNDRERTAYIRAFTHQDWLDARLYDLCLNTSTLGLDTTVDLALASITAKIHHKYGANQPV